MLIWPPMGMIKANSEEWRWGDEVRWRTWPVAIDWTIITTTVGKNQISRHSLARELFFFAVRHLEAKLAANRFRLLLSGDPKEEKTQKNSLWKNSFYWLKFSKNQRKNFSCFLKNNWLIFFSKKRMQQEISFADFEFSFFQSSASVELWKRIEMIFCCF